MNAECSLSALSMKTRELDHADARELHTRSPFSILRGGMGMFMIRDALIWACCASGKEGIRMGVEDMQNREELCRRRATDHPFSESRRPVQVPASNLRAASNIIR
jgi:hypothetical protein